MAKIEYFQPANPRDRALAAAFDFGASTLLWAGFVAIGFPAMGALIYILYILFRDAKEGRSIGKRWRKICVLNMETQKPAGMYECILRNIFLAIPILGYLAVGVEVYFAAKDQEHRRLGDQFAHTVVVEDDSLATDAELP